MTSRDHDHLRPLRSRAFLLLMALLSIALIAAGCGEEETEQASEPTPQEEYVEQVREAVATTAAQSQELVSQVAQARRPDDLARPLEQTEDAYRAAAQDLEQITPPEDVQDLHEQLVAAQEDTADALAEAARAAQQGDEQGIEALRSAGDEQRQVLEELTAEFEERGYSFSE